jgi:bifunctional non-homologous end joining protein LigD
MTRLRFGRFAFDTSNESKLLFPESGITKGDLIAYYRAIAPVMLPHTRDRPIVMHRYPDGIGAPGFYHKATPAYFPSWIRTVTVRKEGGQVRHVLANDGATLAYLANQACITPHTWLSRRDALRSPDQLIIDLDPPSPQGFRGACEAATALRTLLGELQLPCFVKTTGSRGLHVLVPLDATATYARTHAFARDLARLLAHRYPDRLTTQVRKRERSERLYLDTGRNAYAQTAVPAYAVRARPGAPVATPLDWSELEDPKLDARRYHIRNIMKRLARKRDPWRALARAACSLGAARTRLDALLRAEIGR